MNIKAKLFYGNITYTGTLQTYTVTTSGFYNILSEGAQGGVAAGSTGAAGASVSGVIYLTAGTNLQVVVGERGLTGFVDVGVGGGGTFVYIDANRLIQAAGGGGGASYYDGGQGNGNGVPGQAGTTGTDGGLTYAAGGGRY